MEILLKEYLIDTCLDGQNTFPLRNHPVMCNNGNMKTILTGFSVFGDNKVNPTEAIATSFKGRKNIVPVILPVEYDTCWDRIKDEDGDIFIHMGLAASRETIKIEQFAYNEKKATIPDNAGRIFSGEQIAEGKESTLSSPFNVPALVALLGELSIKTEVSKDPGRYVCNNIYYHSLLCGNMALFVHFPPLEKSSLEDDIRTIEAIIEYAHSLTFSKS